MRLFRITVCLLALTAPAFAAENPDFPIQGLERRVEFWKKAFTQYGKDDLVIHDGNYVNLIYECASDRDLKAKLRAVREAFHEIRLKLKTPENLGPLAQRIYTAINDEGIPVSVPVLMRLSTNLHTQRGVKERFRDGVVRSGRYISQFQEILKGEGIPEELALLPLVESSFEEVRSTAGAVGVWQFTRQTGRLYHLRVSGGVDERLDPEKATRAAGRLLQQNHSVLGSWPLALTAYNHGLGGVKHAQRKFGPDLVTIIDKYNGPRFGYASANFYSEFLAAVEIYNNYRKYFGELVLDKPGDRVATDEPQNVVFNLTGLATLAPDPLTIGSGTDLGLADFRPRQFGVFEISASTNSVRSVQVLETRSNIPWTEIVATIVGGLLGGAFAAWRQGLGRNAALFHTVVGPFVAYGLVWAAQSHLVSRLQPDLVASVAGVFVISLLAGWMGTEVFGFVLRTLGTRDGILVAWLVEINQKKKRRSLRKSKPRVEP